MKALILNGAEDKSLQTIETLLALEFENRGLEVSAIEMRDMDIETCVGCFGCWIKTPGQCVMADEGRDIARQMIQSDVVVYLSPVTFGGYSYQLKKVLDRFLPNILPYFRTYKGETHHPPRYKHRPRLISLGLLEKPDAEQERIFALLNERIALNTEPPGYAAGIVYSTQSENDIREGLCRTLDSAEVSCG